MFYLGKLFQAAGLVVILIAFLKDFPQLMGYKELVVGIILFGMGWIIDRYLVKR